MTRWSRRYGEIKIVLITDKESFLSLFQTKLDMTFQQLSKANVLNVDCLADWKWLLDVTIKFCEWWNFNSDCHHAVLQKRHQRIENAWSGSLHRQPHLVIVPFLIQSKFFWPLGFLLPSFRQPLRANNFQTTSGFLKLFSKINSNPLISRTETNFN